MIGAALNRMAYVGDVPLTLMAYDEKDYLSMPSADANQAAPLYMSDFPKPQATDNDSIKADIAKGLPVIVDFHVDKDFINNRRHITTPWLHLEPIVPPTLQRTVVLVGYDDSKPVPGGKAGAFKFINSWGRDWGADGYGWISYDTLTAQIVEAWVARSLPFPGAAPGVPVATAGSALAKAISFAVTTKSGEADFYSANSGAKTGEIEIFSGTISAPANSSGNVVIVLRFYEATNRGAVIGPVKATNWKLFPEYLTAHNDLAGSTGIIPIAPDGEPGKTWHARLPVAAIAISSLSKPPTFGQHEEHFVLIPELYIDDIQLASGQPVPFTLFLLPDNDSDAQ